MKESHGEHSKVEIKSNILKGAVTKRNYSHSSPTPLLRLCQMALVFVSSRPFVSSTLIGATNMAQLKSNIASVSIELPVEVCTGIDKIRREYPMLF